MKIGTAFVRLMVVTYWSGKTTDREGFIEMILSRPIAPYEVIHDLVRVFGDTAVVIDRFGEGFGSQVTWVAIRRGGQWRVLAENFSPTPPADG